MLEGEVSAAEPIGSPNRPLGLERKTSPYSIEEPTLRDRVGDEVLRLFRLSLITTLSAAALIILIDSCFILAKVITPDQRLLTEKVLMTLIGATVVQVGVALAAIVYALFKTQGQDA